MTKPTSWDQVPEDLLILWRDILRPIVESLMRGTYHDLEIRAIFLCLQQKIQSRYGKGVRLDLAPFPINGNEGTMMTCQVLEDGTPSVYIGLSAHLKMCDILFQSPSSHSDLVISECYENTVVVALCHELYHLAGGYVSGKTLVECVQNEVDAWTATCEGILALFARRRAPLLTYLYSVWSEWEKAGRIKNAPSWIAFIDKIHTPLFS